MEPTCSQHAPNMLPKCSQNAPKMLPKCSQSAPKMLPTWNKKWGRKGEQTKHKNSTGNANKQNTSSTHQATDSTAAHSTAQQTEQQTIQQTTRKTAQQEVHQTAELQLGPAECAKRLNNNDTHTCVYVYNDDCLVALEAKSMSSSMVHEVHMSSSPQWLW